jgi:hypothetical protein
MQTVASGVAGLVNMSLIPVGLLGSAVLAGQEKAGWRHAAALLLGIAGLVLVFWRNAGFAGGRASGWASPRSSRHLLLLPRGGAVAAAAADARAAPAHDRAGDRRPGRALGPERRDRAGVARTGGAARAAPDRGAARGVLLGTIVGHSIYLRLLRVWGAFRAGLYAFVSPVVALVAGALVFGESVGWRELAGAAADARRRGGGDAASGRRRSVTGDREQARALAARHLDPGEAGLTQPGMQQVRRPGVGQRREGEVVGVLEQQQPPARGEHALGFAEQQLDVDVVPCDTVEENGREAGVRERQPRGVAARLEHRPRRQAMDQVALALARELVAHTTSAGPVAPPACSRLRATSASRSARPADAVAASTGGGIGLCGCHEAGIHRGSVALL